MKNIATAIIAVMKEVKGMEKNSKVGSGQSSYDGTKDQDVKEVFNEVMARNGLCILPIDIKETTQIDRWEQVYNGNASQKQSVFTKVTVKYMLLHESGESIELMGYGHGVDPQDKGAGKATTYALKNCLLYSFLTPVGKIDDTELKHSSEIEVVQKTIPQLTTAQFDKVITADEKGMLATLNAIKNGKLTATQVQILAIEAELTNKTAA